MFELIQVSEQSYYIQSPAKIGLVKLNEQAVCLIDSGNDKDAGRNVRQHPAVLPVLAERYRQAERDF